MDPIQLLIMSSVAGGIVLLTLGIRQAATAQKPGPLAELYDELGDLDLDPSEPMVQRLLKPAKGKFTGLGRRFTPSRQMEKMRRNATLAGMGANGVESILAIKAVATCVGASIVPLGLAITGTKVAHIVLPALLGGIIGFFLPDFWVSRRGKARQLQIKRTLPETIDLLAIAVQAGMGMEAALELVSQTIPGALGDEFYRLLQEIQLGSSRRQALQQLKDRTEVNELSSFAQALIQADAVGSPIAEVLQSNAARMRMVRRQDAREAAAKLPVKLLFPMLFFIFPALILIIIGPAALSIVEMFATTR
jgi:tight adherence protein C